MNPLAHALFFQEERVLINNSTNQFFLSIENFKFDNLAPLPHLLLKEDTYIVQLPASFKPPNHLKWISIRELLLTLSEADAKSIYRGKQLIHWHCHSLFCGKCGVSTEFSQKEICKVCLSCNNHIYPSAAPAVIMLIQKDDFVLLGRPPHFPTGMYSVLAGFVDPSENCEEAVVREIKEEVGLQVKNVRYFGSQSWPFPNSFMLAFLADYAAGEIKIDPNEIEDAQWFHKTNLPPIPSPLSISRRLIDHFINQSTLSKT